MAQSKYFVKYLQWKRRYQEMRKQIQLGGSTKLKFYNIGKTKYQFGLDKFSNIPNVTDCTFANDSMYITTKDGKVYLIRNKQIKLLTDISNLASFTSDGTELGLVGIAHSNGKFYLSYTTKPSSENPNGCNLDVDQYDLNRGEPINKLIRISFRNNYHHGGHLVAKDSYLYLGTGDGGPQGDPHNEAQNINTLLGKMIKIDLDSGSFNVIALGLRNPWMFSIDNENRMWIGDVGWDSVESVKVIPNVKSDQIINFGWNYYEGSKPNRKSNYKLSDFTPPVFEYPNSNETGKCIIGGFFVPELSAYLFADFLGIMMAIQYNDDKKQWQEVGRQKILDDEKIYSLGYHDSQFYVFTDKQIYLLDIFEKKLK